MRGKTYLRYDRGPAGGVVASPQCQAVVGGKLTSGSKPKQQPFTGGRGGFNQRTSARGGRWQQSNGNRPVVGAASTGVSSKTVVAVAALEAVNVYNVRTGELVQSLVPRELESKRIPNEVTALLGVTQATSTSSSSLGEAASTSSAALSKARGQGEESQELQFIVAGYASGHVAVFQRATQGEESAAGGIFKCLFYALGHKSDTAVQSIAMSPDQSQLVTGGLDTDLTVWDLAAQEPLYKMRGHRGAVVGVHFALEGAYVISAAADGLVKVWQLDTQHCVQTVIATDSQVTSLTLDPTGSRVFVGLRDNLLKVFRTSSNKQSVVGEVEGPSSAAVGAIAQDPQILIEHGVIQRKTNKAATHIVLSSNGEYLAVASATIVEIFSVLSQDQIQKKLKKRRKRERETGEGGEAQEDAGEANAAGGNAADEVSHLKTFHFDTKIRALNFLDAVGTTSTAPNTVHFSVVFSDNRIESYIATRETTTLTGAAVATLSDRTAKHVLSVGHRADVKNTRFTSDDMRLCTLSEEALQVWRVKKSTGAAEDEEGAGGPSYEEVEEAGLLTSEGKLAPLCKIPVVVDGGVPAEATCFAILPGDVHVVVGTKTGHLSILSIASTSLVFTTSAHVGEVNHLEVLLDGSGLISAGADRRLCRWELTLTGENPDDLSLESVSDTELTQTPLSVAVSNDGKFCAACLQDNNVQLFFLDTMKPYLQLYGHKLPASSVAFSADVALVVTGGMDKSLRFWGTDFGDCHRAIHAHDDYITCVRFVAHTHYVFSASLDGTVKHWDGDNWTLIQRFQIHQRGVWSLALSSDGSYVATAGVDRCIRTLVRGEDIVYPEEEEEKMAQEIMEEEALRKEATHRLDDKTAEVGVAGVKTVATAEAAETLMDAMDRVSVELQRQEAEKAGGAAGEPNPLFRHRTVWEYLWSVIESIRPSEMRHALTALTSVHAASLLDYIENMLEQKAILNYELAAKLLLPLVRPAPGSNRAVILSFTEPTSGMRQLHRIKVKIQEGLLMEADRMGLNGAALVLIRKGMEEKKQVKFFDVSKIQGYKKKYHKA